MKKINLDGIWLFKIGNKDDIEDLTLDTNEWHEMNVPSNWYLQGLNEHAGVVWYKKNFFIEDDLEKENCWLCFNGVDYFADVWVNNVFVGSHEGYFQTFQFNISELIKKGENNLIVKVDSPFEDPNTAWPNKKRLIKGVLNHHDCRPGAWHPILGQSKNTGGIWGTVALQFTDIVKIDQIKTNTTAIIAGLAEINIDIDVLNLSENSIEAELLIITEYNSAEQIQKGTRACLQNGNNRLAYTLFIKNPQLWWTWDHGDPNLYKLKVIIEWENKKHESEILFGIRTIRTDETGQILLNNTPLFIRGTNIIPTQWFTNYYKKDIEKDISLLINANVNAVRIHAHVTCPDFYNACDRAGLLVWQDFPLQWGYEITAEFVNSAKKQIREMVDGLYNHPSIYCWCCHNEPPVGSESLDEVLQEVVIENDPSRIVLKNSTFIEHPYHGWYEGFMEQFIALPGGPIPSEFGAQALPDLESLQAMIPEESLWPPNWDVWAFHDFQYDQTFNVVHLDMGKDIESFIKNSQDYQYRYIKYVIEMYRRGKNHSIFGVFQFMFVDCWPAITWSVVDCFRKQKRGYEALKIAYQPILISFDIRRYEVINGMNIFAGVYIVNDFNKRFDDVYIEITVIDHRKKELIKEIIHADIPPNSSECILKTNYLSTQWRVPKDAELGKIKIEGKIFSSDGQLLSVNHDDLKIVVSYANEFTH